MRKFVSVSGGKDSTATALLLWERKEDFELIWADTGAELPENYWIVPRLAQLIQKPLHVVSNGTFFQWLVKKGYFLPGVAPYTGAWIETAHIGTGKARSFRRTLHGCVD